MNVISHSEALSLAGPYIGDELADLTKLAQGIIAGLQTGIKGDAASLKSAALDAHTASVALMVRLAKASKRLGGG